MPKKQANPNVYTGDRKVLHPADLGESTWMHNLGSDIVTRDTLVSFDQRLLTLPRASAQEHHRCDNGIQML